MDSQRAILNRKIASAEARSTAESARALEAAASIERVVESYFGVKAAPIALRRRALDRARALSAAITGAWFHLRRGETDVFIGCSRSLVAASVNVALVRPIAGGDSDPTAIERSIAAAFAARLAGALVPPDGAAEAPILVQAAITPADLKLGKATAPFEVFETTGYPLTPDLRVDLVCAIAADHPDTQDNASTPGTLAADLAAVAFGAPLVLTADLGRIEARVRTLIDLAPGMILPILDASADRIALTAPGARSAVLAGRLGALNGRRAVMIAGPV